VAKLSTGGPARTVERHLICRRIAAATAPTLEKSHAGGATSPTFTGTSEGASSVTLPVAIDEIRLHSGYTDSGKQKAQSFDRAKCLILLGWLMGLEPTTTGITILDSTN
jgi:hypothetical protein